MIYGVILTTARCLGEYGAVAVVSGRIQGKTETATLRVQERYESFDLAGAYAISIVLALIAVVVISGGPDEAGLRPSRAALLLAFGAGAAIALQLVCLDQAPGDSGIAPLIVGRAVSSAIVLAAVVALHRRLGDRRPSLPAAAGAGALDSLANLAFLLAVREGELAVVAVITALYPAATVLLARGFLAERIGAIQLAGLGLAAVAVSLLAVG